MLLKVLIIQDGNYSKVLILFHLMYLSLVTKQTNTTDTRIDYLIYIYFYYIFSKLIYNFI